VAEALVGHAMTDLRSVRTLARVAASGRANRQAIVAAGGLEVFVALVARGDEPSTSEEEAQELVARLLASMAADALHRAPLCAAGGVPALLRSLGAASRPPTVMLHSATALAHLALSRTPRPLN
jgi:hypothetical protein